MTQNRLNNVTVLHVDKHFTDKLSLIDIANDFVLNSSHRKAHVVLTAPSKK